MPNREKLLGTLEYLKQHPDRVDLDSWICGTTACYAGHVALQAGATPVYCDDEPDTALIDTPDGRRIPVSTYAAQILDISDEQGEELFNAGSLDELERTIRGILCEPSADGTGAVTAA
jgi:hypothetical protein